MASGGGGGSGGIDANSHNHPNKEVLDTITQGNVIDATSTRTNLLDTITQEMLDNALREMLGVESTGRNR